MKIKIAVILAVILSGCATNSPPPSYYYNNGYGNVSVPLDNQTRVTVPIGKSSGKIGINTPYGYIGL